MTASSSLTCRIPRAPLKQSFSRYLFVLASLLPSLLTLSSRAQTNYYWSNFAGYPMWSGNVNGTGTSARFNNPGGVAVDGGGNVYVAETFNNTIRKVTPSGMVTTLAGSFLSQGSTDGAGSSARFHGPSDVAVDRSGNVYVADAFNHTIRKITSAGVVTTLAGSAGNSGSASGRGSAARFNTPRGVAVDGNGNVFVADSTNHRIRKVTPSGDVTTLAGSVWGSVDGMGASARFAKPSGVAVDGGGNVYVADFENHTIRKVAPDGMVTTLAGSSGSPGGADGPGSVARFRWPNGVEADGAGNVYVADYGNYTIRKVTPAGVVSTIGGFASSLGTASGAGSSARFRDPSDVAVGRRDSVRGRQGEQPNQQGRSGWSRSWRFRESINP